MACNRPFGESIVKMRFSALNIGNLLKLLYDLFKVLNKASLKEARSK